MSRIYPMYSRMYSSASSASSTRLLCQWGAVLLLGIFFALTLSSAAVKSATMDEGAYLAKGYAYLKTLDLRFQGLHNHPPLAGAWEALPLVLDHRMPQLSEVPGWDIDRGFFTFVVNFYYRNPDIVRYTLVGRIQVAFLGVLLGALVFRWAGLWFGWKAGLLACFLYVFSPNILAHAGLSTTDLPAALTCFATMVVLQGLLRRPSIPRAVLTGLVLGSALLVKYSALLLVPTIGVLLVLAAWWRNWHWAIWPGLARREAMVRALAIAFLIFVLAGFTVWAGFGFEIRPLKRVDLPFPVPAASFLDDVVRFQGVYQGGRAAFLLGHRWVGGRWYYFPATLLFKTPPPALFLLVVTLVVVVLKRRLAEQLPLWLFPTIYFFNSLASGFNIGHRHLLPVLPFGFVLVSQMMPAVYDDCKRRWSRALGILLAVWYLAIALWVYPDYLAYFNLFAGGPSRGYQVLLDSNLDWGQDLIQLRRYMERNGVDEVWLSLFSLTDPALYGVRSRKLPDWEKTEITPEFHYLHPDTGTYVISATLLQGLYMPNPSTFDWFLHRNPLGQIGYSMLVYRVEEDRVSPSWVGMCAAPEPPLSPEQIAAGFGRTNLRVVYFDCRTSWVIPWAGVPGWYVIPASAEGSGGLSTEWLREAALEFEQYDHEQHRVFAVYRVETPPMASLELASPVGIVRGDAGPGSEANDAARLSLPLDLGGVDEYIHEPATFLGYDLDAWRIRPGDVLTVKTFWKARRMVTETLPSVFVHLVDRSGVAWSVGDALDFSAIQWQDGDIFVQQHSLVLPPDVPAGTYWIASGLYDLVTGARYPVRAANADTSLLGPVVVEPAP